jgi:hypothetical protein
VQNPVGVKVLAAVEKLKHDALYRCWRDRMPRLLSVVVNNLKQIVFCILKDHKDALVLEHNLTKTNDIVVVKFAAQAHLTDSTLRDARVADLLAFLVRLELLDGELANGFSIATDRLVNTSIGTGADETNDAIPICNPDFGLISSGAVVRFYMTFLVSVSRETEADVRAERHRQVLES